MFLEMFLGFWSSRNIIGNLSEHTIQGSRPFLHACFSQELPCETLTFAPKPQKTHEDLHFFDRQVIGHALDAFQTVRHARARAQKVNRQVIGHANGNAMRCKGRCPITCLSANCHVRLLACPISADRQVIGQIHGYHIAVTLPWPLPSHCRSIAIT